MRGDVYVELAAPCTPFTCLVPSQPTGGQLLESLLATATDPPLPSFPFPPALTLALLAMPLRWQFPWAAGGGGEGAGAAAAPYYPPPLLCCLLTLMLTLPLSRSLLWH